MAFGDFATNIVARYRADTRDMERGLRRLKGAEKERHETLLRQAKEQNSRLDRQIAVIGKVAAGIGAVTVAWKAATASLDFYAKRTQATTAAAGVDIEGLKVATKGLRSETQLLEFAAAAMNGGFEITQQQMETAGRAMVALRNQGNDLDRVMRQVTKALVEGNAEGLREFGVIVQGSTGKVETFNAVLSELERISKDSSASVELATDPVARAAADFQDATDKFKLAAGELSVQVAPIISALASGIGQLADEIDRVRNPMRAANNNAEGLTDRDRIDRLTRLIDESIADGTDPSGFRAQRERIRGRLRASERRDALRSELATVARGRGDGSVGPAVPGGLSDKEFIAEVMAEERRQREESRLAPWTVAIDYTRSVGSPPSPGGVDASVAGITDGGGAIAQQAGELARRASGDADLTGLAETLSAIRDEELFVEQNKAATEFGVTLSVIAENANVAQRSIVGGLAPALASMSTVFAAVIDGSMSGSDALASFSKTALLGVASVLDGIAVEQGVQAAASFAVPPKAAAHAAAAAAAIAGAIAVRAIAGTINTGGKSSNVPASGRRSPPPAPAPVSPGLISERDDEAFDHDFAPFEGQLVRRTASSRQPPAVHVHLSDVRSALPAQRAGTNVIRANHAAAQHVATVNGSGGSSLGSIFALANSILGPK